MVKSLTKLQAFALRVLSTRFLNHGIQFGHEEFVSQIVPYSNSGPLKLKAAIEKSLIQNTHTAIDESDDSAFVTVKFEGFEFQFKFNKFGQLYINCIERTNIEKDLMELVAKWQKEAVSCYNQGAESDMAMAMEQTFTTCASQLLEILEKSHA